MASKINADEFVDREGEGKPTLPKGVVLSGVTTITTAVVAENEVANSTGINVGIITSTHFKGNLTGDVNAGIVTVTSQSVIGSAVTISASGIDIGAGVITATSYAGSGANLTGVGATIMVWDYNPDPYDSAVTFDTGIGITFNQKIKAGSGNITLSIANAGVAGTVVENFGIGNSVTITNNALSLTPTSDLSVAGGQYCITLPSGVITNMAGESYVGTAYTFEARSYDYQLWSWGYNSYGNLGHNSKVQYSSPIQVPGTTWSSAGNTVNGAFRILLTKTDGTLWAMGGNFSGELGQNSPGPSHRSSPVQIPGTTWSSSGTGHYSSFAIKTDGTLWSWGAGSNGRLGLNDNISRSSPVQIPGTTWASIDPGSGAAGAIKTDGTLWMWGDNSTFGKLGQNNKTNYSSPVQIPGTTWSSICVSQYTASATKTDGTLWTWGNNDNGALGHNAPEASKRSSPTQVPGTTWSIVSEADSTTAAIKTDGTLWTWGGGGQGQLAQNNRTSYSSPVQIPGTTWSKVDVGSGFMGAIKTDGTAWSWGYGTLGSLGHNNTVKYSSPVQIGSGTDWHLVTANRAMYYIKRV